MKIGIGVSDITPELGMCTEIFQNLHCNKIVTPLQLKVCIIYNDEQKLAIVSADVLDFFTDSIKDIRNMIKSITGIPEKSIFLNSSHSHSSPYIYPSAQKYLDQYGTAFLNQEYYRLILKSTQSAAQMAIDNIQDAKLKFSRGLVKGVACNRRVELKDGTIGVRYGRDVPKDLVDYPDGLIDPYVSCLWFEDKNEKVLGSLINYACHGTSYNQYSEICWDYMGFAREEIQNKTGGQALFLQGCAGNMSPGKYTVHTPIEDVKLLGSRLADAAIKSYASAADIDNDILNVVNTTVMLKGRTTYSAEELKERIINEINKTKEIQKKDRVTPSGAMVISYTERYLMAYRYPDLNIPSEVAMVQIGDVIMFFLPSESFIQYALELKEALKNRPVMVMAYTDCTLQYIPNKKAFEEKGGYETDPDWSYSAKGNGEKIVETAKDIMKYIK